MIDRVQCLSCQQNGAPLRPFSTASLRNRTSSSGGSHTAASNRMNARSQQPEPRAIVDAPVFVCRRPVTAASKLLILKSTRGGLTLHHGRQGYNNSPRTPSLPRTPSAICRPHTRKKGRGCHWSPRTITDDGGEVSEGGVMRILRG